MADQVRVFVSHHHSPEEDAFTARLVADLEAAGADVWVDSRAITSNNFVQKISEGMEGRQWLVLVMTPASVTSKWVKDEVNTAIHEVNAERMLGVIPIVMAATRDEDMPVLWRPLQRYDATRAYELALDKLLRALGLPTHATTPDSLKGLKPKTPVGLVAVMQNESGTQEGELPTMESQPAPMNGRRISRMAVDAIVGPIVDALPVASEPEVMGLGPRTVPLTYELSPIPGDEATGITMNWLDGTGLMTPLPFESLAMADSVLLDPLPNVPAHLASLGFRGVNVNGIPAIIPPLISIPAGPFFMGGNYHSGIVSDEHWAGYINLAEFQIAKYPVTVAEYALAVGTSGGVSEPRATFLERNWKLQRKYPDHPVVCISWNDALAYCAWLRVATGQPGWRLLTEAEWEKAARWDPARHVSHIFPWGKHADGHRCNTSDYGPRSTTPVGSYPASDPRRSGASACGVEEMVGNVWEWTSTLFKHYPYTHNDGREDQEATGSRVLRGRSFADSVRVAQAGSRLGHGPDYSNRDTGFRLAFSPATGS